MRPLLALSGVMAATAVLASAAYAQTPRTTAYDVNLHDNRFPEAGVQVEKSLGGESKDRAVVRRLHELGIDDGAAAFGQQGRWYLFAAARGRSVGLNMVRDRDGHISNVGLSTDQTALVGSGEAGLGWRKGDRQISLGYQQRRIQTSSDWISQTTPHSDHGFGLALSWKPAPKR